jgi:hypothetical protein
MIKLHGIGIYDRTPNFHIKKNNQLITKLSHSKFLQQAFLRGSKQCYKKKESSNNESKQKLEAHTSKAHKWTEKKLQ